MKILQTRLIENTNFWEFQHEINAELQTIEALRIKSVQIQPCQDGIKVFYTCMIVYEVEILDEADNEI